MSQLHLLLVIDSEDPTCMTIEGMETAPVDSDASVWDDETEVWREPTDEERETLMGIGAREVAAALSKED